MLPARKIAHPRAGIVRNVRTEGQRRQGNRVVTSTHHTKILADWKGQEESKRRSLP